MTDFSRTPVAICCDIGSCVATERGAGMARCARDRAQCAYNRPVTVHCAVNFLGRYSWTLFMNTVYGHC